VQVLTDSEGRADEVVFERPDGAEIPVDDIAPSLGLLKDEEEAVDGPVVLWFDAPDHSGCEISIWLRRRADSRRMTRPLSVVAAALDQLLAGALPPVTPSAK
jgi:hypothetical protein